MTPTSLWLIAGVVFLALEALGLPGVGFLFAGLSAILTGILVSAALIGDEATLTQFIVFFAATALFATLLWKPLKKFRVAQGPGYSNMVGDTAIVGAGGLTKGLTGDVTWSGTIMKAKLLPDATADRLETGAQVVIVDVTGATLIVKPKQ